MLLLLLSLHLPLPMLLLQAFLLFWLVRLAAAASAAAAHCALVCVGPPAGAVLQGKGHLLPSLVGGSEHTVSWSRLPQYTRCSTALAPHGGLRCSVAASDPRPCGKDPEGSAPVGNQCGASRKARYGPHRLAGQDSLQCQSPLASLADCRRVSRGAARVGSRQPAPHSPHADKTGGTLDRR